MYQNLFNATFQHLNISRGWQFYCNLIARLSDDQLSHLRTINWLLNGDNRGKGRTFLMAIGFIRETLRTGKPIEFFDHAGPDMRKLSSMERIIENMISTNRFARENFTVTTRKLRYKQSANSFPELLKEETPEFQPPSGLIEDIISIVTLAKQRGISEEKIREAVDLSLVGDLMNS